MHQTTENLSAGLPCILQSPKEVGTVKLIVRRPAENEREILSQAEFNLSEGVSGDNWKQRPNHADSGSPPDSDTQINIMNARVIELIAGPQQRWAEAGDQLYLDLDLSSANMPPGTRIQVGSAILEITAVPHTGCRKFRLRFGTAALKFVNAPEYKALNLRGLNAKVVQAGTVSPGDEARKL